MISPIYGIWNRGQAVTAGCRWIWLNKGLAFRLVILPHLLITLMAIIGVFIDNFILTYIIPVLYIFLLLPVQPALMFHIVENPDKYHYPEQNIGLLRVYARWWHYFWPFLKISFISGLADIVLTITFFGALLMPPVQILAMVICQRDPERGISSLIDSFKMIFNSMGTALMCILGGIIIFACMMGIPLLTGLTVAQTASSFINPEIYNYIINNFNDEIPKAFIVLMCLSAVLSLQIIMVIANFFYGHCKEKNDHPALIYRMDNFS